MSEEQPTSSVSSTSIQLKDLLIPISIVVAGIVIGAGLYLGGGNGTQVAPSVAKPTAEAPAADTTSKIDPITDEDHVKGNRNAKVKIVEYSDFECPFCQRHHQTLQTVVDKLGGDTVAWVFRQFPLEQLHPVKANAAALASECVGELGGNDAFWVFTDSYFKQTLTNNRTNIETLIPKIVTEAGVDAAAFKTCFESARHQDKVDANVADAVETGGRGTPWSIIIGPSGKTYPINGAQPASVIEQMIEVALSEA